MHALHVHISSFDILKTFLFFLRREMTCFVDVWTTWAYDDKLIQLEHIFQAQWLWVIEKRLQNREVTFSDDILASVDVVFA